MIDALKRLAEIATVSTWALFGAGIVLTGANALMVLLLWLGNTPPARWLTAGDTIAIIALMFGIDLLAVIFALAKARVAAKGPGGLNLDLSSGGTDAPPAPSAVKVTAEVKQ